jgi:pumilio family protein 6
VPQEERQKLLTELFEIITGRVHDFVFKHDSVRTIQCALKYSTMPQRIQIAEELKGSYRQLAESRYAKFLVAKLITKGNERIRDMIIPEFYGHVRRLINHPEASWILDDIYRGVATSEQKTILLREWYGPEFVIFKSAAGSESPTAELSKILASSPEKSKPILDYLHSMINQLIQKKLTGFTMLHDAMLQYFLNIKPGSSEATDFLKLMIGDKEEEEVDLMRNLAFTTSGSRLVCLTLAYGTAKDRRQLLRTYKDTMEMLACDKDGHSILLTAYDVVDDTREITLRIFSELVLLTKTATEQNQHNKIIALIQHQIGHMSLLYPFTGSVKWMIPPQSRIGELLKNIHQIRSTTSKKHPATRQKELVTALSPLFLSTIAAHAGTLSESSIGCHFITETLISGVGDKDAAVSAVADLATGDPSTDGHISMSRDGGRMLKILVNGGHFDQERKEVVRSDPKLHFAQSLYERIRDWILKWATSSSSFVVVALSENDEFDGKEEMKKKLRLHRRELERAAAGTSVEKMKELNDVNGPEHLDSKKHTEKDERAVRGNAGTQLLLKILDE